MVDLGIRAADDIDAAWLTEALHGAGVATGDHVRAVRAERIGTGQVGESVRFHLTWADGGPSQGETPDGRALPATVVGKFPSHDERSRAAGAAGPYSRELGFYRDLWPQLEIPTPTPLYTAFDPVSAAFTLLMNDISPASAGDQLAGCDVGLAARAVETIALLHAPTWGRAEQLATLSWLPAPSADTLIEHVELYRQMFRAFAEQFSARIDAEELALGAWIAEHLADLALAHTLPPCAVHNDFRLDNLLIGDGPGPGTLTVVDWQTVGIGFGPCDVAYFIGTGLATEPDIDQERALVERYRRRLVGCGVHVAPEDVWRSYRLGSASGYIMAVIASQLVVQTERGDAMFTAMARRSAAQMRRVALTDLA